jgi:pimeloyl-ACP methyl ester carboxylesterase/predicted glycosyltransferase
MVVADAIEPSRAVEPRETGHADVDGVRIAYEVFGEGEETILLLPPWAIVHSRFWKLQVPHLARHFRVVTFDARGNGGSDRPQTVDAYGPRKLPLDAMAVLDAAGIDHCVAVVHCGSAASGLLLCVDNPERIRGALFMSPALPLTPPVPARTGHSFDAELDEYEGWAKANRHHWARDFRDYAEFFFAETFSEPHSTKQIEDAVGWSMETDPETLAHTIDAPDLAKEEVLDLLSRIACPLVVVQGDDDRLVPADRSAAFSALTGAELVTFEGAGHCMNARHPVQFNHLVADFAERVYERPRPPRRWRRALSRQRRALYVSSPIGLGHAWRDVAIARELRKLHPDLQIDWLAQEPVTQVLEACGESIHPASRHLAGESRHIASEARGHELDVFQAWRRMDEILLNNFMVFDDIVRDDTYDLWIGDEAWELDYFLHENPELKRAAYAFLTDFVGWIPLPEGGADEARLTADYNAEMIEQIARFPYVRDRAIFVGSPEDVVPRAFGDGLPDIRPWVEEHFDFSGYVLAPGAGEPVERDPSTCIVTVGGSGVGGGLLQRVIDAAPLVPDVRMTVVCGPRIDPATLSAPPGVEIVPYVHELSKKLASAGVAVTQGGLTTSMELAAAKTPFVYAPLARHFEQQVHVRHRLERYGAGRAIDLATATPESIAAAIAAAADQPPPADVERDGAARAAQMLAELL